MLGTLGKPTLVTKILMVMVLVCSQLFVWWKIDMAHFALGRVQLWDLDIYWQTAKDVVAGQNPLRLPYMQTSGPPLVIAPYLVFALVSLPVTRSVMTYISILMVAVSAWIMAGLFVPQLSGKSMSWRKVITALCLQLLCWIAFPTRFTLLLGQPNLILMCIISFLVTTKDERLVGMLSGILAVIKTNFIVLMLSFVTISSWKSIVGWAIATIAVVAILASPWLKPAYYHEYLTQRAGSYLTVTVRPTTTDYYNQSLRSTLNRIGLGQFSPIIWLVLVICSSLWLLKSGNISGGLIMSLLVSPILWSHYVVAVYPLLIVGWSFVWQARTKTPRWILLSLGASSVFLLIEFKNLHAMPLTFLSGIVASHYFIGLWLLVMIVSSGWYHERYKEISC